MTAQVPEKLYLDGYKTDMTYCPPLPEGNPRLVRNKFGNSAHTGSTGCWRNYVGTWEIKDSKFYLVDAEGYVSLKGREPLFADWVTGILRVPQGEMLQYVHMGFGSVHESELHIKVEKGIVVSREEVDNRGKDLDERELGYKHLPGSENPSDGEIKPDFSPEYGPSYRGEMNRSDSIWRFGSSFRVRLFGVSVFVLIVYLVSYNAASRAAYMFLGLGVMGLFHEARQRRINRMSEEEQLAENVSAMNERRPE